MPKRLVINETHKIILRGLKDKKPKVDIARECGLSKQNLAHRLKTLEKARYVSVRFPYVLTQRGKAVISQ